ncbi:MAG: hypothetical protein QOE41_1424 [Mycobacterium sp.]|nr:hypothetical protein [Mycobacterium sp.]
MGVTAVAAAVALAMLSRSHAWVLYLTALTACGFTLGLVYAFTTVANQAVVSPQRAGFSKGGAIDVILVFLAAGLLPAGAAVLFIARLHRADSAPDAAYASGAHPQG